MRGSAAGGARFLSGSDDYSAKLWTIDGALERTFKVSEDFVANAALPDGVHFAVGLGTSKELKLYHVDGTLVHTFVGHTLDVMALTVTPTASTSSAARLITASGCGASPPRAL